MLVYAHQGLVMIGYSKFEKRVSLRDSELERQQIKCFTSVSVICDESMVKQEIDKAIIKELETSSGWGSQFEGWTDFTFSTECEEDRRFKMKHHEYPLRIEYIKDWKMDKIFKTLSAEQYIVLMKELDSTKN